VLLVLLVWAWWDEQPAGTYIGLCSLMTVVAAVLIVAWMRFARFELVSSPPTLILRRPFGSDRKVDMVAVARVELRRGDRHGEWTSGWWNLPSVEFLPANRWASTTKFTAFAYADEDWSNLIRFVTQVCESADVPLSIHGFTGSLFRDPEGEVGR